MKFICTILLVIMYSRIGYGQYCGGIECTQENSKLPGGINIDEKKLDKDTFVCLDLSYSSKAATTVDPPTAAPTKPPTTTSPTTTPPTTTPPTTTPPTTTPPTTTPPTTKTPTTTPPTTTPPTTTPPTTTPPTTTPPTTTPPTTTPPTTTPPTTTPPTTKPPTTTPPTTTPPTTTPPTTAAPTTAAPTTAAPTTAAPTTTAPTKAAQSTSDSEPDVKFFEASKTETPYHGCALKYKDDNSNGDELCKAIEEFVDYTNCTVHDAESKSAAYVLSFSLYGFALFISFYSKFAN